MAAASTSDLVDLVIERPAAGGRMLARHEGIVVLVAGAIPGERIRARIERRTKNLLWATCVDVLDASSSRRPLTIDPACGGLDFAHIEYDAQRALKSDIVVDAFRRIGKISLETRPVVEPSPDFAYRLRARLHVQRGRAGFFLEGTHTLCDAGATGQLGADTMEAVNATLAALGAEADACTSIVVAENVPASQRVIHLDAPHEIGRHATWSALGDAVTGVTVGTRAGVRVLDGVATVTDTATDLSQDTAVIAAGAMWTRSAMSFFQGNRYLTGSLLRHVLALVPRGRVADLYSGVGLFAVACAARGDDTVAVEGDPSSGHDLELNAAPWTTRLRVMRSSVEEAVPALPFVGEGTIVVDPPRTGLSPAALDAIVAHRAAFIVYVSCDPATLARDAAKILTGGYAITSVRAFDLFPNTAHVETVVAFVRSS